MKIWQVLFFILKVTFLGFGGGNALFPIMKSEAVDKRKWLNLEEFDQLVAATNMIPGPSVVESLAYISMKVLGKYVGTIVALIGIFPHIIMAWGIYLLADKFLEPQWLFVIAASVIPVIIGFLINFAIRYIKASHSEIGLWPMLALALFTILFTLFIPSPYNIPAIIMVIVTVSILIIGKRKIKKKDGGGKWQ